MEEVIKLPIMAAVCADGRTEIRRTKHHHHHIGVYPEVPERDVTPEA
ncbi:hypothetical protein [Sinorhizobium meliloti]|nr:hypothetical protein [Sinorhizobium meliloti]